jgi:hypothetical protein
VSNGAALFPRRTLGSIRGGIGLPMPCQLSVAPLTVCQRSTDRHLDFML